MILARPFAILEMAAERARPDLAKGMGFGPDDSCSVLRVYETMLGRKVKP